jgi:hypothetical protein
MTCTETARFEGDRIAELRDEFDGATRTALDSWLNEHGSFLQDE